MRDLPNTDGSFGYGEAPGETGDFRTSFERKAFFKELIAKANSVPLIRVLKYYGVKVDAAHPYSVCPFKNHKGGRETTGSFKYYDDTNSFYCFGCKVGKPQAHACEFIAAMEDISLAKAAYKVMNVFGDDVDPNAEYVDGHNFSEQLEIMMDFSNTVRDFRSAHLDKESQDFIEQLCAVYDGLNAKRPMDNEALQSVVEHLKEQIKVYTKCHTP
jgi:hypothetical protein